MIRTKEDLLQQIKNWRPDDTSDEMLGIIEDISDYYDANASNDDWRQKYEENDSQWRKKYSERFFENKTDDKIETEEIKEAPRTFEELFKEE